MRTREPAVAEGPAAAAAPRPFSVRSWAREHAAGLLLVALAGAFVAGFFLLLYWVKQYPMPIGWDTPRYLDQTNLVAAHGLAGVPKELPPPIKTLPSRGGFPVVILTLSSLFTASTFKLAAVVPPVAAAAIALAAAALVTSTLRRPAWEAAVVAVIVGTSAVVVRLVAPETYTDNLFGAAVLTAALVAVVSSVQDGGGLWAGMVLLAAGGLAHGPSLAVVALALFLVALVYAPTSWRSWRSGEMPLLSTPSGRIGAIVAGGGAITAAGVYGILHAPPDTPKLSRGELIKKLHEDVPLYRYWFAAPLAAVGTWALAASEGLGFARRARPGETGEAGRRSTSPARLLLLVLLGWTAVSLGGVALYLAGRSSPAHRFLSFMLPLPILMAIGILALARLVIRRVGSLPGGALVVAATALVVALGAWNLYGILAGPDRGVEWLDPGKVQDAATAAAYLDAVHVPDDAPIVFVIDDSGPNPLSFVPEMAYMLRSVLPADRLPHTYFYVGNPDNYLAGRPTYREHPATYDANEDRFWPTIRGLLPRRPVALLLASYDGLYRPFAARHPDRVVAPNVIALSGPRPAAPVAAPPIPTGPRSVVVGVGLAAGALAVLGLIGLGWGVALLPRRIRPFEVVALAPAFGIAFLILAGIAVDAVGVRLTGAGGAMTPVLAAAGGSGAAAIRFRRDRR